MICPSLQVVLVRLWTGRVGRWCVCPPILRWIVLQHRRLQGASTPSVFSIHLSICGNDPHDDSWYILYIQYLITWTWDIHHTLVFGMHFNNIKYIAAAYLGNYWAVDQTGWWPPSPTTTSPHGEPVYRDQTFPAWPSWLILDTRSFSGL